MDLASYVSMEFVVMALMINCIIVYIKSIVLKIRNSKPLPFQKQIIQAIIFGSGIGGTFLAHKMGQFSVLIGQSELVTGMWIAILSIIIYEIGLKDIFKMMEKVIKKKIDKDSGGK